MMFYVIEKFSTGFKGKSEGQKEAEEEPPQEPSSGKEGA
jgi:hypothetical protein